jgi:hypothetical protein
LLSVVRTFHWNVHVISVLAPEVVQNVRSAYDKAVKPIQNCTCVPQFFKSLYNFFDLVGFLSNPNAAASYWEIYKKESNKVASEKRIERFINFWSEFQLEDCNSPSRIGQVWEKSQMYLKFYCSTASTWFLNGFVLLEVNFSTLALVLVLYVERMQRKYWIPAKMKEKLVLVW